MDRMKAPNLARKYRKWAAIAAVVLAVGTVTAAVLRVDFSSQRVDRQKVSLVTVQRGTMEVKVAVNGELRSREVEQLTAQVQGRVVKLLARLGDTVRPGQLLVELTNPQLLTLAEEARSAWEGAVREKQASLADLQSRLLFQDGVVVQAKFSLEKARLQLESDAGVVDQGIISKSDFKRSQLNVAQAEQLYAIEIDRAKRIRDNIGVQMLVADSKVSQVARAHERAKDQAANLRIVSGLAGVVQAIDVEIGQQVQPGMPVGRIALQDQLYAELKVPSRDAVEVKVGQPVAVDTRSGIIEGAVSRIDPGVAQGAVIVQVDLKGALPPSARPQLQVEGTIFMSRLANVLFVGKPAFVKADSAVTMFKLDATGRYAELVTVDIGKVSLTQVEVRSGLAAGDRIITSETGEWKGQSRVLLQ
jgi:HlyD family secretion protein